MKELGRGTAYNTYNITSLIRTPQACIRHLADGRILHGERVYTHTHTHTHTHTSARAQVVKVQLAFFLSYICYNLSILSNKCIHHMRSKPMLNQMSHKEKTKKSTNEVDVANI